MTWSAPQYDRVYPMTERPDGYTLYKYHDRRVGGMVEGGCGSTPVFFVPGHVGQYEQGRSIGAHGYRMGHVKSRREKNEGSERLQSHYMQENWEKFVSSNSPTTTPLKYLNNYETYTISFSNSHSMLHRSILSSQMSFLIRSIDYVLKHTCKSKYTKVVLVGHSAGGIVARNIFNHPDYKRIFGDVGVVDTIITLATPHEQSPLTIDEGMSNLYAEMHDFWSDPSNIDPGGLLHETALISVGGASRDETVPTKLIDTTSRISTSISVLSPYLSNFLTPSPDGCPCGTDHRAIVWCRNVLLPIRDVILAAVSNVENGVNKTAGEKREQYERTILLSNRAAIMSKSKGAPMLLDDVEMGPIPTFAEQMKSDEDRFENCMHFTLKFLQSCSSPESIEMLLIIWVAVGILFLADMPKLSPLIIVPFFIYRFTGSASAAARSFVLSGAASLPYVLYPPGVVLTFHLPTIVFSFPSLYCLVKPLASVNDTNLPLTLSRPFQALPLLTLHVAVRNWSKRKGTLINTPMFVAPLLVCLITTDYGDAYMAVNAIIIASMVDIANLLLFCPRYKKEKEE